MPGYRDPDDSAPDLPPNLSPWQRRVLERSRRRHRDEKAPLGDRLRTAFLKPVDPDSSEQPAAEHPLSLEELEAADKVANDKERLIGLVAAPVAAAIGIIVISSLIANDPAALLKNGEVNKLHVDVSVYHDLTAVLLGLSVVILVAAMMRKRIILGIAMALYGLAIFNLHFWGFGIPFILGAAWYLMRGYRLHRAWREASGDLPYSRSQGRTSAGMPRPNKRYTPPTSVQSRASRAKPANAKRAG